MFARKDEPPAFTGIVAESVSRCNRVVRVTVVNVAPPLLLSRDSVVTDLHRRPEWRQKWLSHAIAWTALASLQGHKSYGQIALSN
jgi:hypothetical protein